MTLWMVWFGAVTLLVVSKWWVLHEDTIGRSDFQRRLSAERVSVAARRSVMADRLNSLENGPPRTTLKVLADCAPFKTVSESRDHRLLQVEFRDHQFAIVYLLKFYNPDSDDIAGMSWSSEYTESRPGRLLWDSFSPVFAFLTTGAVAAWIVCVLLGCIFWHRQMRIGEGMLAMALLCAVLGVLDQSANGFLSADRGLLVYAGFMFVVSIVMMVIPHRHRALADRCGKCDYDLTGNRSGICPECGDPIPWARSEEFTRKLSDAVAHVTAKNPGRRLELRTRRE